MWCRGSTPDCGERCQDYDWDWVNVLRPTRHKIGHFGDTLPSQSLSIMQKELTLTQQKHTCTNELTQNNSKKLNITHNITAEKLNLTNKKLLYVSALHYAQLLHTILILHLIMFPLPQTIITAPMMSIWGKGRDPILPCINHDNHCDSQLWRWAAHCSCIVYVDSAITIRGMVKGVSAFRLSNNTKWRWWMRTVEQPTGRLTVTAQVIKIICRWAAACLGSYAFIKMNTSEPSKLSKWLYEMMTAS